MRILAQLANDLLEDAQERLALREEVERLRKLVPNPKVEDALHELDKATFDGAVAAERERCAKIAEGWIRPNVIPDTIGAAESRAGQLIAAEIRATQT